MLLSHGCLSAINGCTDIQTAKKHKTINAVSFIYDIECIPIQKMVRTDTLWRTAAANIESEEPYIAYVATGDCSFCIADAFDFIRTYYDMHNDKEFKLLLVKGGEEVFRYYMEKEDINELTENITTIFIPEETYSQDGIYLVYNGRIINYASWNIK